MVVFGRSSLNTPITEYLGGGEDTYYVMKIEEIFGKKSNG
jgi:chaperonin GroES